MNRLFTITMYFAVDWCKDSQQQKKLSTSAAAPGKLLLC